MNTNNCNFTFDDIGNREDYSLNNGSVEYDCNSVNQYVNKSFSSMGTNFFTSYHHDSDGNLVDYSFSYNDGSDSQQQFAWIYTWNAENRMTSATNTADGTYVTYKYDYQGRMFEKVTNGVTNNFVWNGLDLASLVPQGGNIIAEMTDSATNLYTWSQGETLCASLDGETVFYAHDANKNVTDLVDDSGNIVAHYEYSPFGVITTDPTGSLTSDNPFRFSNEYFDETTGQVEFLNRKYFPQLGKFASRDPIGVQGGLNEYGICGNDLINHWDEWGLKSDETLVVVFLTLIDGKMFPTEITSKLLNSIDDKLVWKIKKESMPDNTERGKQGGKKKYDDECWKKIYFIKGELYQDGYELGSGNDFKFQINKRNVENEISTIINPPYYVTYKNVAPFLCTHEALEALGLPHLSPIPHEDNKYIMDSDMINSGWIVDVPAAEIHEKTKKKVRRKLKLKGWWKIW
jgi:RHS repeat-associated protein